MLIHLVVPGSFVLPVNWPCAQKQTQSITRISNERLGLNIEKEVHDIAVVHHIFLTLDTHLAGGTAGRF